MKKQIFTFILIVASTIFLLGQTTYVPDDNFEQALIDLGYDDVLDDYVLTANISGVTNLNVSNKGIVDLTGIEAFISLNHLNFDHNQVSNIDVSNNISLTLLSFHYNDISSIDVSKNISLNYLGAYTNQLTSIDVSKNTSLTQLNLRRNNLTSIDVSNNTGLQYLWLDENQLSDIDVSNNSGLIWLVLGYNELTEIDVSNNSNLGLLTLHNNRLNNIDLSYNTSLYHISIHRNQLTNLDVSNNPALTYLGFEANQISLLDITNNNLLETLVCGGNNLGSLDISNHHSIEWLSCENNQLLSLNVKNSNNSNFTHFDATGNLNLTCIKVDDASYSNTNWSNKDATASYSENCSGGNLTYVPDDNFEQSLIDLGYDDMLDDYVVTANIENVVNLEVATKNISDLTGLEDFESLRFLDCSHNNITSLNVTGFPEMDSLDCRFNQLSVLDLTNNTDLLQLRCGGNNLTSLDITNNNSLFFLSCFTNNLSSLDLSNNPDLAVLSCSRNNLSSIDLSNNVDLEFIDVGFNDFSSLDLSANPNLAFVMCMDNQLTSLNIKNGNNTNITEVLSLNNPDLACIQVDDAAWSDANWPNKDATATYSENCSAGLTYVPDDNFEQALIDLGYDDVLDDYVVTENVSSVISLVIDNRNISDLTGIDGFTGLLHLNCRNNNLTELDLSGNSDLQALSCGANSIIYMNVSNNPDLAQLDFADNPITEIDVSENNELEFIQCSNSKLTSLSLTNHSKIKWVQCGQNSLMEIDVSGATNLEALNCSLNELVSLDLSNNSSMKELVCHDNNLSCLNLQNGSSQLFTSIYAVQNPQLFCIQVDDENWAYTNWNGWFEPHVTFSENCSGCSGTSGDTDGDGIADNMDDYPNDATKAFNNYFPAGGFGSLAFEDMWPGKGDYDFNDVVVDYQFLTVTNASNKVVEVTGTFAVKASGAGMENGFGFNLPDANNSFAASPETFIVSGYDLQEGYVSLNSSGHEENQSKPTIIVFDNVYNILPHAGSSIGVNTEEHAPFVPYDTLHISITTQSLNYTASDFSLETWNPFIIVNQDRTHEIHLPNYAPTDLADVSMFGMQDDNSDPSIGRYYKTANNLPWAINITSEFSWPVEKISIDKAYLHFIEWAESSGEQYNNWYENTAGYMDESMIYRKE